MDARRAETSATARFTTAGPLGHTDPFTRTARRPSRSYLERSNRRDPMPTHPHTPDGRCFVVKETLWRCSNPGLSEATRQALVGDLMRARRAVKQAKAEDDASALQRARASVHAAKLALGERGAVWWTDGSPDYNRRKVTSTPYAE